MSASMVSAAGLPRVSAAIRRAYVLAMLVVVAAPPVAAVASDPIGTTVQKEGRLLEVRSTFGTDAPAATCYEVLADFEHLAEFVPGLRTSRIVSPTGAPLRLHQVGVARAGFFSVTLDVTLDVRVEPPQRVLFDRVAGNLRQMRGSWTVAGDTRHCVVQYEAEIEPAFWVPPFVGPLLMRNQVEEQMTALVAEMGRRSHGAANGAAPR